jgi:hypothetical protein
MFPWTAVDYRTAPDSAGPTETGPRPGSSQAKGRSTCWCRVKDSNLRSFRDGLQFVAMPGASSRD